MVCQCVCTVHGRDKWIEHAHADLDDFSILRPVIESILRQAPKGTETCANGQNNISLGYRFHSRLRALYICVCVRINKT